MTKTSNHLCDLDLWPPDQKIVHDTLWPHGLCAYLMWIESVKQGYSYRDDTVRTSNDPYHLDLWPFILIIVRGTSSLHVSCVCQIWNDSANQGWSHAADMAKTSHNRCDLKFKWLVWPWPLTFWSGNGWRHIDMPWTISVPSIKQIGQIGTEPRNGHKKKLGWPLWTWPLIFWPEILAATSIS